MRLVGVIALLGACSLERPVHTCDEWADCGVGGACEPGTNACSFADTACSSGRRFSELATAEYADKCVEIVAPGERGALCEPGPTACTQLRSCIGNRCVTVDSLSGSTEFFTAHCANATDRFAPMAYWGNTSFAQFIPLLAPFNTCDPISFLADECPMDCHGCTMIGQCPNYCLGSTWVTSTSVGDNHYCITNGKTYCFGANDTYQVGNPVQTPVTIPSSAWIKICPTDGSACIDRPYNIIASGIGHSCGTMAFSGNVECWGDNTFGQRGPSQSDRRPSDPVPANPFPTAPGENVLEVGLISASGRFTCAATSERVACWGETPTEAGIVDELTGGSFTALDTGERHACVIDNKHVKCWGANDAGQSAPGVRSSNVPPAIVLPDLEFQSIATGRAHTCALTTAGVTYCWGDGSLGQLGADAIGPGPVIVHTPTGVGPIAAGLDSTCALQLDDRVRCWGDVVQIGTTTYAELDLCQDGRANL